MNIIFLCGSLEPGQDGVGDYTRRLACELLRKGHQAAIISLNDKAAGQVSKSLQTDDGTAIEVLRLPQKLSWEERMQHAQSFIDVINPQWLSLQYVPFAYHDKGLPFGLPGQLTKLGRGKKWHVMFHELWVGIEKGSAFKLYVIGYIQQLLLSKLIKELQPARVSTQTHLYQMLLKKKGVTASFLPLFGNVPVTDNKDAALNEMDKELNFIVFGSIHGDAPVEEFVKEIANYGLNKHCRVNFIGRNGGNLQHWKNSLDAEKVSFKILGVCEPEAISAALSNADIGISTTPLLLAEKSGTVVAMQEHGLEVICVRNKWVPWGIKTQVQTAKDVHEYKPGNLAAIIKNISFNKSRQNVLKTVAQSFSDSLQ